MALSYLVDRRNAFNTPWTAERDAILVRMWADGYSASQIATEIKDVVVSRMAVIGRVHRLQLPSRKPRQQPTIRKPYTRKPRMFVPKPPPRPPKPPPPPPGEPKMRRVSLLKLRPHDCRWPIGDGPFLFCGVDADETYCPFHQRIAKVRG